MPHKLVENENACLYIENDIPDMLQGVFLHWEIHNWTPSVVKEYKKLWPGIIQQLQEKIPGHIYALPPTEFEEKLIGMFGFKYTGLLFNGIKIMRYEGWD